MKITRIAAATAAGALLTLFGAGTATADEYAPPPTTAIDAPSGPVGPGQPFTVTFDASPIVCDWALSPFEGQTAPGASGTSYTVTLNAPTGGGTYTITALCTWDPNPTPAVSTPAEAGVAKVTPVSLLAEPQTDAFSVQITVDGNAAGGGGSTTGGDTKGGGLLPDTGGARTELLLVGAGLVAAGAGVTIAARRRHDAA